MPNIVSGSWQRHRARLLKADNPKVIVVHDFDPVLEEMADLILLNVRDMRDSVASKIRSTGLQGKSTLWWVRLKMSYYDDWAASPKARVEWKYESYMANPIDHTGYIWDRVRQELNLPKVDVKRAVSLVKESHQNPTFKKFLLTGKENTANGKTNNWEHTLNPEQVEEILDEAGSWMQARGYNP